MLTALEEKELGMCWGSFLSLCSSNGDIKYLDFSRCYILYINIYIQGLKNKI